MPRKRSKSRRFYQRFYEGALIEADAVDFVDLVAAPDKASDKENPEVKEHVSRYKHVLIDEYQDVNFASASLLQAIRETGNDVWVVADQRQSIYRFRGALAHTRSRHSNWRCSSSESARRSRKAGIARSPTSVAGLVTSTNGDGDSS